MKRSYVLLLSISLIPSKTHAMDDAMDLEDPQQNFGMYSPLQSSSFSLFDTHTSELELKDRKAIFAIRESMIEECINQYKVLTSPSLRYEQLGETYEQLCGAYDLLFEACTKIYPLYDRRVAFNKERNIEDKECDTIFKSWLMLPERRVTSLSIGSPPIFIFTKARRGGRPLELGSAIRDDLEKSMEIYEKLYSKPHHRKVEFLNCIDTASLPVAFLQGTIFS